MRATNTALHNLHQALEVPPQRGQSAGTWRWSVRQQMAAVRDVLIAETAHHEDEWLAARGGSVLRERNSLLKRLSELGPRVLESEEIDTVRDELMRLLGDIRHHVQRLHDLAYDEVEMEIGGSE
jgi:Rad3-related DNA helicase